MNVLKIAETRVHILSERNMRWYFGTQLISLTGLMLRSSLLSLLIIDLVGIQKAPSLVGFVWALNVLPGTFLGIFAGMVLDAFDKRRILQWTAVIGALQAFALAYLAYRNVHHIEMWKIMSLTLCTGFTNAIDGIGRNAIVKDAVVNKYNQRIGGTIFTSLYTVAMIIGNGIAGYLVLYIGYANSFVLNGLSFLVLIYGLHQMNFDHINRSKRTKVSWKKMWRKIKFGGIYTFTNSGIRICILIAATITVFGFSYNVILSVIARTMFNGGPIEYSHLAAAGGIGSLAGALSAILWSDRRTKMFVVLGSSVLGASLMVFSKTTNMNVAMVALFFCGFGFMAGFSPVRGAIMHIAKRTKIGIVLGFVFTFFYGGMMLSSFGAGFVAKHYGCPVVLMTCGVMLVALAVFTPFLPGIKKIE